MRAHVAMVGRWAVAAVAALLWPACLSLSEDYGSAPFACSKSPACPTGYQCVAGMCRRGGAPDGGAPDGRAPDGAADHAFLTVFVDDFSKSTTGLVPVLGSWSLGGGVYRQTSCSSDTSSVIPDKSWPSVRVTADVRGDSICGGPTYAFAGLLAHYSATSMRWCGLDFTSKALEASHWVQSAPTCPIAEETKPVALDLGVWYSLAMVVVGTHVTCSVSAPGLSAVSIDYVDDSPCPTTTGTAGLTAEAMAASFDNFVVTAP